MQQLGVFVRFSKTITAAAVIVASVLSPGLMSAGTANAAVQYHDVRAQHSNMCLDVQGISQAHTANVAQAGCWGGPNQHWRWVPVGGAFFEIRAQHSDKCLDVAWGGVENGANVIQGDCWGGANQHWRFVYVGGNYYYEIRAQHSDKCLDVSGFSRAGGANVHQWACWGGANEHWFMFAWN
jgi:hypothetical protein